MLWLHHFLVVVFDPRFHIRHAATCIADFQVVSVEELSQFGVLGEMLVVRETGLRCLS